MIWGRNTRKKCNYGTRNPQRNSWGDKFTYYIDPYASCSNEAEILEGKNPLYCKEHGCPQCFYEEEGVCKVDDNWLCKVHHNKHLGDKKLAEIEDQVNKVKSLDSKLETELKEISNDFYILIQKSIYFLNQAKEKFIRQDITNQMFAKIAGGSIIDTYSILSPTENDSWKGIYDPNQQIEDICQTEKTFLTDLAEDYKNKSEAEKDHLAGEARKKSKAERKKQEELKKKESTEEEQKRLEREKNKREQRNDSNDNEKNFPNSDKLNNYPPIDINPSPQTNDSGKREREREREREIPPTRPRRTSHAKIPIIPTN